MASIPIHPATAKASFYSLETTNPLPRLLQTPSGLALLELQGTINLPSYDEDNDSTVQSQSETPIGRLIFPDYHPETQEHGSTGWMNRVYLYVGKHQRLTGEVKKLPKAFAVIRKRHLDKHNALESGETSEELEVVEIIKWKILFSTRPEPVGTWNGEV